MPNNRTNPSQENTNAKDCESQPRLAKVVEGAYDLSLGISMVVAVLLGFGLGWLLKKLTDIGWLLWLGIFWGIAAAILNVYKAYKRHKRELDSLADNPRYAYNAHNKHIDDEDDEGPYDK
ncbi:AtpZ/AtpI family protein [Helicobacter sp. 23-1048]